MEAIPAVHGHSPRKRRLVGHAADASFGWQHFLAMVASFGFPRSLAAVSDSVGDLFDQPIAEKSIDSCGF